MLINIPNNDRIPDDEWIEEADEKYYVRLCFDEECPNLSDESLHGLDERVAYLLKLINAKKYIEAFNEIQINRAETEDMPLLNFIWKYYKCYSGLRYLYNLILNSEHCLGFILNRTISFERYPAFIKYIVSRYSPVEDPAEHLTTRGLCVKWANDIKKFLDGEANRIETHICVVCSRLRSVNEVAKHKVKEEARVFLPDEYQLDDTILACRQCRKSLNKKPPQMPLFATKNNLEFYPSPPEPLNRLNWIGNNLIQRVKPLVRKYSAKLVF